MTLKQIELGAMILTITNFGQDRLLDKANQKKDEWSIRSAWGQLEEHLASPDCDAEKAIEAERKHWSKVLRGKCPQFHRNWLKQHFPWLYEVA